MGWAMPALPRVRMGCTLSTGVMETDRVAVVLCLMVEVPLETTRAGCSGQQHQHSQSAKRAGRCWQPAQVAQGQQRWLGK